MEEWRVIEEFPDFSVSDLGRIMNNVTGKTLTLRQNQNGALMTNVRQSKQIFTRSVGLLVAKAFCENTRPDYYNSVIMLNNDPADCRAENIMWRPRWYVLHYRYMFTRPECYVKPVYVCDTDEVYPNFREMCIKFGIVDYFTLSDLIGGTPIFHWCYTIRQYRK